MVRRGRPRDSWIGKNDGWLLVLNVLASDPVSDEMKKLEGTWVAVAIESDGHTSGKRKFKHGPEPHPRDQGRDLSTIEKKGKGLKCTITIDPTTNAEDPSIECTRSKGRSLLPGRSKSSMDDTLRLCTGWRNEHARPGAFTQHGPM